MKHILNDLTEQEKNAIREQHTGGMKVITENFSKLTNSKLGDSKPFVNEQPMPYKPSAAAVSMSKPIIGMLPQIKACVAQGGYPKLAEFLKKQENKQLDNIVIDMLMTFSVKKDPQASSEIGRLIDCLQKPTSGSTVQNKGINEQSQSSQYKVGQVIKALRDKDNQMYTLKVSQVVPDATHIAATISGPGKYEGKALDGKFPWELNIRVPGELSGNMEMGTFKIQK